METLWINKFKEAERIARSVSMADNERAGKAPMKQMSGVMLIIIIGGGTMLFTILFIFAKRQIMRFTLRSRRGPHMPVGNDAKKALRREIERRLDCIQKITEEPKLLWTDSKYILQPEQPLPPYHYRMQTVDDVKILEKEIAKSDGSIRHAHESLRAFLLNTLAATLNGSGQRMIHQFCDIYEHARHDPNEYGREEYEAYQRLLLKLIDAAKQLKSFNNSRKSSPARTPRKQTKMHSLLDPARLRPPSHTDTKNNFEIPPSSELTAGQHSKVNLTLGLQGRDIDITATHNQLHLQPAADRDIIIRNRIKTPSLTNDDDEEENNIEFINPEDEGNDIASIASAQLNTISSVV